MNTPMEPIRDRVVQISREVEAQDQDQEVQAHMIHLYSFSLVLKCSDDSIYNFCTKLNKYS